MLKAVVLVQVTVKTEEALISKPAYVPKANVLAEIVHWA
jgi:hypothetical protein